MLSAIIIDDEPLAHQVIQHHLQHHPDIVVTGQCYQVTEALPLLANSQVDLLFLDINMPGINGIELLKVLANKPQVIIISAYQEYALAGFELDVTDYLLKPVPLERFNQALEKVRKRLNLTLTSKVQNKHSPRHLILKVDRDKRKFELARISYFEAYGNFVKIWQDKQVTLATTTLKQVIEQVCDVQFTQLHKSFVVNNTKVETVNNHSVTLDCGASIKIGKSFKHSVKSIW
jgi:DNA-binding LytR/AlgR family response regulator